MKEENQEKKKRKKQKEKLKEKEKAGQKANINSKTFATTVMRLKDNKITDPKAPP